VEGRGGRRRQAIREDGEAACSEKERVRSEGRMQSLNNSLNMEFKRKINKMQLKYITTQREHKMSVNAFHCSNQHRGTPNMRSMEFFLIDLDV